MTSSPIIFRTATKADAGALRDLAELDSTHLREGDYAVAEIEGRIVAAVNKVDGVAIADPFLPTGELVSILRAHALTTVGLIKKPRLRIPTPKIRQRPRPAMA